MRPRLGVLAFNPIQYHAPLYQRLARRKRVEFDVLYLSDHGFRAAIDPGFGVQVAWNIDLLSGYMHHFLTTAERSTRISQRMRTLTRWLLSHDAVIVHGYVDPWMLVAMAICRSRRIPYLLRGESHPHSQSTGLRRYLRYIVVRTAVCGSAGGLAIGQLNAEFYRQHGARRITFAPYSVDDERFARPPLVGRSELLAHWRLDDKRPVIMFCGKLIPRKRPLDLAAAIRLLPREVTALFVGDGSMADRVRASLRPGAGAVTGFVNQSELPSYYHAADILVLPSEAEPWGLVVNEAMAAGALPVVSDRVGSAPDLVRGIGEVYPCGDVTGLAAALSRALVRIEDVETRDHMRRHVARYSLDRTAAGFEQAALAIRD
jgi:glycosyltransferase involved in cell wall biosynthesis